MRKCIFIVALLFIGFSFMSVAQTDSFKHETEMTDNTPVALLSEDSGIIYTNPVTGEIGYEMIMDIDENLVGVLTVPALDLTFNVLIIEAINDKPMDIINTKTGISMSGGLQLVCNCYCCGGQHYMRPGAADCVMCKYCGGGLMNHNVGDCNPPCGTCSYIWMD